MALKATIFKVNLNLSNFNLHHYEDYSLTMARHPSENNNRLFYRLLAFSHLAHENLSFTKGLSTDSEPEIWGHNPGGEIEHWVDLGQPDEKRIRQSCGKSKKVSIYSYQSETKDSWFEKMQHRTWSHENLSIFHLSTIEANLFDLSPTRSLNVSCQIQDNEIWMSMGEENTKVTIEDLKK